MQENLNNVLKNQEVDTINIREELEKYLSYWRWFVLGGILALVIAFLYLRYSSSTYTVSSTIMIKDNQKSGISDELKAVADLGIVGTGSTNNTDNEIFIIKSRKIIGKVVDTLNLQTQYFTEGRIKRTEVYLNGPIRVNFEKSNSFNLKDTTLVIQILDDSKFQFSNIENTNSKNYNFNQIVQTGFGNIMVEPNENISEFSQEKIYVVLSRRDKVIDRYIKYINVSTADKNSSVINLSLTDPVKDKARDILNELVIQYNIDAIRDKNIVSEKTKNFIEDRLISVGNDLALIQDNVKNYKTKFGITGLSTEGELALEEVSRSNQQLVQIKSQLSLANWIQKKLNQQAKDNDVLPTNLGFNDDGISSAIENYNTLVLQKNTLLVTAGLKNPQLIEIQNQINSLQQNLLASLSNLKKSLEIQLNQLNVEAKKVKAKITNIPLIERGIIDIERQKEIYSELYSYLLKKKEETAISLAVTVPNAKIIDYAYGSDIPVAPKKQIIYLAALVLGLILPFIVIYLKNLLDTKLHTRKDIEQLTTVPFIGDVPHSETEQKIVIGNNARTSTAEAFRLIRTNLDFMLPERNDDLGKTIFITSTTSGEGKSFISINLSAALSLSNKKVLLLGMDLRAPKVTEYLGISERKGITNYIMNTDLNIDDIKFTIPEIKGLDIIASGVIPPNPAELLLTDRVKQLMNEVKKDYDYIIVDTAPVNLVTDTLLISKYSDMVLYVSRANYLDKRMLVVPQKLYEEKKLPNMAFVLNDTDMKRGYGYGYGYGYGNAYVEEVKKPWYKKIFSS
ncbi:GumC family protein [Polaribacter dokdonensis]|uniref:non-specific protein-tyrosine kinase n=1 Tax=Polaribacter dokdonensis DSW-5 TaxID=1300348 RepID=A0A0M9CEC2_9FLAO|nr:tyrosine-protein kinase [Polaribacter dokdonensis]KOY50646.1 Tyrosine-protein kinase involved in exopolysaccharide biosynthesis [Polaribacter dokdonensis DSW-5]SEE62179.1 capsular exopolysaccharide family [Polaribacter dokdonensis DSW-5]